MSINRELAESTMVPSYYGILAIKMYWVDLYILTCQGVWKILVGEKHKL